MKTFFFLFVFSFSCAAITFEDVERYAQLPTAPRTLAMDLNAQFDNVYWKELAWRKNTALLRYLMRDKYGRISAGWYLADVDEAGALKWYVHTDKGPDGTPALELGQGADVVTTVFGLSQGFVESNPISAPGAFAVKLGLIKTIKSGSAYDCIRGYSSATQIGWGAALWNVGIMAGLGPVSAVSGVAGLFISKPDDNTVFWQCAPKIKFDS